MLALVNLKFCTFCKYSYAQNNPSQPEFILSIYDLEDFLPSVQLINQTEPVLVLLIDYKNKGPCIGAFMGLVSR